MKREKLNIITLTEVDSTNNYANRLISEGSAENGSVVVSHYQKSGRGQRGNSWESAPGKNLLASIIVFPQFLPAAQQFYLSKIISLTIYDWLSTQVQDVSIKWPNDIFVGKKKIAGILIENSILGSRIHSAVIGFGINLNQVKFSPEHPNAVSLKLLTKNNFNIQDTVVQLHSIFMNWLGKLESGLLEEINRAYHRDLFRRNEWALYWKDDNLFEARILGTGEFGQLILEDRDGRLSEYMFKEVEFVI
jgi:BirA family biotin operon repressor/biotin-[acetyl-CoA-carboxylase] ligase